MAALKPTDITSSTTESTHRGVIIDNEYCGIQHIGELSGSRPEDVNWNTHPPPSLQLNDSRPPCASTIAREIESPIPSPSRLVE